jgi:D-alanyl-D-alanine carboxypeptidase
LELGATPNEADTVIYEKDADKVTAPASITKLLTVITAIEISRNPLLPRENLTLEIKVGDYVIGLGANAYNGDQLSFTDCIAIFLLQSLNVWGNVIARVFGRVLLGSDEGGKDEAVQRFISEMNRTAQKLGMTRSEFMNPHGRGAKGQKSTARDLSLLAKACLNYEQIVDIWGRDTYTINVAGPKPRTVEVKSSFRSSTEESGIQFSPRYYLGGKTGTLPSVVPPLCHLVAVSKGPNGKQRISAILGSPTAADRYQDYLKLAE